MRAKAFLCVLVLLVAMVLVGCDGRPNKTAQYQEGQQVQVKISGVEGMVIGVYPKKDCVKYKVKVYVESDILPFYQNQWYKEYELKLVQEDEQ